LNISRRAAVFIALEGESIQTRIPDPKGRMKKEKKTQEKRTRPGSKGLPLV
jgi:hypothetical protein